MVTLPTSISKQNKAAALQFVIAENTALAAVSYHISSGIAAVKV